MTLEYDIDQLWWTSPSNFSHNCQLTQIDQLYLLNAIMCYSNQQLCCYPCQHDNSVTMDGWLICMSLSPKNPLYTESLLTREIIDFIDSCFLFQGVESQSVGFCGNGTLASVLKALPANLFKAGIHMGPFHI